MPVRTLFPLIGLLCTAYMTGGKQSADGRLHQLARKQVLDAGFDIAAEGRIIRL